MAHKIMIDEGDDLVLDESVYDVHCPDCEKSIFHHDKDADLYMQDECDRQFTLEELRRINYKYEELDAEDLRMIAELEEELEEVA